jgi:hypothetical protein
VGFGSRGAHLQGELSTNTVLPPANWIDKSNPTRSKCTLTGLTSGQKLWVPVKAIGASDEDPSSDVVWKMLP